MINQDFSRPLQLINPINESNQIINNSHIEETWNFEKSSTVLYLTDWLKNKLVINESSIESLNQKILPLETLPKLDREKRDELSFYKEKLQRAMKNRESLQSMGNVFQSEEKIKRLVLFFLQDSLIELGESEWQLFWGMIKRETKYCDDYYVMYTSYSKDGEIRNINNHLEESLTDHKCSQMCFTKKIFRRLIELEFKSLEEAYKRHIFTQEFNNDHAKIMGNHFICTNLTIFGNSNNAESTIGRFLVTIQVPPFATQTRRPG